MVKGITKAKNRVPTVVVDDKDQKLEHPRQQHPREELVGVAAIQGEDKTNSNVIDPNDSPQEVNAESQSLYQNASDGSGVGPVDGVPQEDLSGSTLMQHGIAGNVTAGFGTAAVAIESNGNSPAMGGSVNIPEIDTNEIVLNPAVASEALTHDSADVPVETGDVLDVINESVVSDDPVDPVDPSDPVDPIDVPSAPDPSLLGEMVINEVGLGVGTSIAKQGNSIDIVNENQNFIEIQNLQHQGAISAAELNTLGLEIIGQDGTTITTLDFADADMSAVPAKAFLTVYEDGTWAISKPGGGGGVKDIKATGQFEDADGNPISFDWDWGENTDASLAVNLIQTDSHTSVIGSIDLFTANGVDQSLLTGGQTAWEGDTFDGEDDGGQVFARNFTISEGDPVPNDTNTENDWDSSNAPTERAYNDPAEYNYEIGPSYIDENGIDQDFSQTLLDNNQLDIETQD